MNHVIDYVGARWDEHNSLLKRMVAPLNEEQLILAPREGFWSIRMLACHIVASRAWWWHDWMGEGGDDLKRLVSFDDDSDVERPDAGRICGALDKSWQVIKVTLERWADADLSATFQRPRPGKDGTRPWRDRRYILWHVAEHDVHHGGEISLILGMHGLKGIDM